MNKNRIAFVDTLRAFSLLGVVIIHTLSFHLTSTTTIFFWNILQFVVVAFIFCSGLVAAHYESAFVNTQAIYSWYKKRLGRLYLPFLVYFVIHFSLFFVFPRFFTHFGLQKNITFFLMSLTLFSGTNTNWLPLIFIELTVLTPLLFFLQRVKYLWLYILFALCITSFFTIFTFPYVLYRYVMWIPWSLIFLLGLYYSKQREVYKRILFLFCVGIFSGIYIFYTFFHKSLLFYDNKYPPTLYYLSFGIVCTMFFSSLFSSLSFPQSIQKFLQHISKNSYSLFFIHYIVLDFLESTRLRKFYVLEIFVVVLVSLVILMMITVLKKNMTNKVVSNVAIEQ